MEISFQQLIKLLHAATGNVRDFVMDNEGFIIDYLKFKNLKFKKLTDENKPNIGDMILYEGNLETPKYGKYLGDNKVEKSGKIDLFDKYI